MKTNLLLICLLMAYSFGAFAQSTSLNPNPNLQIVNNPRPLPNGSSEVITFSEYPVGTTITDQYKRIGIIFDAGTFTSPDGANPTAPVLSGTPRFQGPITGRFVVPGTDQPTVVKSFTFDAGYFDNFGSTRIEWFNLEGEKLGQRINSILGIEQFTIEGGNIAHWTMSIVADEPAGFAIDNVSFVPVGPSILFREKDNSAKEGTWGVLGGDIPGFDHVALHIENKVYESHPGYKPAGMYVSRDGAESVTIVEENGVQSQFTRATFEHDSQTAGQTKVVEFEEIPIDEELAKKMRTAIESKSEAGYKVPDFSFEGIQSLLPANQKGSTGNYTCIGLVEWAAEQSGYNGGQGFILNAFESFYIVLGGIPFEVPTLSPELMNYAMKSQQLLADAKQWVQGFFDPVDFIVTDPLGRRLGFTQGVGSFNEIPYAFYPGDGGTEQFLIPQAIPGTYKIKLTGKGAEAFAAVGALDASESFKGMLTQGQVVEKTISVKPTRGCMGDVNLDGAVDSKDLTALSAKLNQFTDGLGDPGDLDGDGLLSNIDLELLRRLIGGGNEGSFAITGVNTVSCEQVTTYERRLTFTPQYAGLTGAPVSFSITNEMPVTTNPGPYTLRVYIDNPTIKLYAQQGSDMTSFDYNWLAVCGSGPPPPPGTFTITGVNTVSCEQVTTYERRLTFTPQYAGLTGAPVSFSITNEMPVTTNPGPYTLRVYIDNPTIKLYAQQGSDMTSFDYNWLAVCGNGNGRLSAESTATLSVVVLGNPVAGETVEVEVRGATGQPLRLQLTDIRGRTISETQIERATSGQRATLPMGRQPGLYVLQATTPAQKQTLKLLKP